MVSRQEAIRAADAVICQIMEHCERIEIAGSIRRGRELVHDADMVVIPKGKVEVKVEVEGGRSGDGRGAARVRIGQVMRELHVGAANEFRAGEKMVSAVVRVPSDWTRGTEEAQWAEVQVDVYFATQENFGMILCVRTGSANHNIWMAQTCKTMGMKFAAGSGIIQNSETRDQNAELPRGRTEEEVFGALGLMAPEPELREIACGTPLWMKR